VVQNLRSGTNDIESCFSAMINGLTVTSRAYDALSDYTLKTVSDCFRFLERTLPPSYVLDLRDRTYTVDAQSIMVGSAGTSATTVRRSDSANCSQTENEWTQIDCNVLRTWTYTGSVFEVDIGFSGDYCRILLDTRRAAPLLAELGNRLVILLRPKEDVQTLDCFLREQYGLELSGWSPREDLGLARSVFSKQPMHFAFRHTDLHALNCLVSRSHFKILDVGDSSEAMLCCDAARLEISLLAQLIDKLGLQSQDVARLLLVAESGRYDGALDDIVAKIAMLVLKVRSAFFAGIQIAPGDLDILLCYYSECCEQISCSISSPMGMRRGAEALVRHWERRLKVALSQSRPS
jgi:hypothetical protein